MEPPLILCSIFGLALMLSAAIIAVSDEPQNLPFFTARNPIRWKTPREAKIAARKVAKYVAIIGGGILLCSIVLGIILSDS